MCGIVGHISLRQNEPKDLAESLIQLNKRGPDHQSQIHIDGVSLGHARLSIIDTSTAAHQPMTDESGRYTIIFNGEIFNYRTLKAELEIEYQEQFKTTSDTEVLLILYKHHKEHFLNKLNGFWAFAIYDAQEKTTFISRDRYGEKPLLYFKNEHSFGFASEMKALIPLGIEKKIDVNSMHLYFQLNYIPAPHSIFEGVKKLLPGQYILIKGDKIEFKTYYTLSTEHLNAPADIQYAQAKKELRNLVEEAVDRRLVADVPLGSFLSGGVDSSVVSGIASQKTTSLNTFSIGFADEPFFDETKYANIVAKHLKTNHTVFSLSNDDLFAHLHEVLDYINEPFADSSALAVYILSQKTREHVTVALSGDGADEIFAGYHKHKASAMARKNNFLNSILKIAQPVLSALPQSRQSKVGNLIRQANRFAIGVAMSPAERYWRWCCFADEAYTHNLLLSKNNATENAKRIDFYTQCIHQNGTINEELYADVNLVLQNDMLVKVDWMSMANSLEIRSPFLDYNVMDYAFQLPTAYKIEHGITKKIIKETFADLLPQEIFHRPKKGFEVPLLKWFRTELKSFIVDDLLSDALIERQNIFSKTAIQDLKNQLFSNNPGEVHAQIWALIVFQTWWKKYMDE